VGQPVFLADPGPLRSVSVLQKRFGASDERMVGRWFVANDYMLRLSISGVVGPSPRLDPQRPRPRLPVLRPVESDSETGRRLTHATCLGQQFDGIPGSLAFAAVESSGALDPAVIPEAEAVVSAPT